ncbi:hypothetical protein K3495_g12733 [Podosphaera aphanis]|nr:hypothetical protein K3495_g12733 [Podosphaera aphanis]
MDEHRSRRLNPKYSREEHGTSVPSPRERERDTHRGRNEDRYRERDRRYRSRSRDSRSGRHIRRKDDRDDRGTSYRDRDRERDRDRDRERDRRHDDWDNRGRNRERHGQKDTREGKRERSRSKRRNQNGRTKDARDRNDRRDSRSRSPAVDQPTTVHQDKPFSVHTTPKADEKVTAPPVSFKVGSAQEPDRMDIDSVGKKPGSEKTLKHQVAEAEEEEEVVIEEENDVAAMKAMMGFGSFSTTHQKKVPGNNVSAVRKEKKTEYRQYMNRVGGFNRPLSPSR